MPESTSTDFANLPYPAGSHAVAVPADMMQLAEAIEPHINLHAADEADRDVRYRDVPAGTTVVTPEGWLWVKTSSPPDAPTWYTLSSVETSNAFAWDGDWEDDGGSVVTKRGQQVQLDLRTRYVGETFTSPGTGYITPGLMAQIPAGFRPSSGIWWVSGTDNGSFVATGPVYASGTIRPRWCINPDSVLEPGTFLAIGLSYMVGA